MDFNVLVRSFSTDFAADVVGYTQALGQPRRLFRVVRSNIQDGLDTGELLKRSLNDADDPSSVRTYLRNKAWLKHFTSLSRLYDVKVFMVAADMLKDLRYITSQYVIVDIRSGQEDNLEYLERMPVNYLTVDYDERGVVDIAIPRLPCLDILTVTNDSDNKGVAVLQELKAIVDTPITFLRIDRCMIDPAIMSHIGMCKNLRVLRLGRNVSLKEEPFSLSYLRELPLKILEINVATAGTFVDWGQLPRSLERLYVDDPEPENIMPWMSSLSLERLQVNMWPGATSRDFENLNWNSLRKLAVISLLDTPSDEYTDLMVELRRKHRNIVTPDYISEEESYEINT